jgi:hypothetical protein
MVDIPTLADFAARFPVFVGTSSDAVKTALIAEAANYVDDDWDVSDQKNAILYLTAHLLATDNSAVGDDGAGSGVIASESISGMSISYNTQPTTQASQSEQFGQTTYGRRFFALLQRNKTGPVGV